MSRTTMTAAFALLMAASLPVCAQTSSTTTASTSAPRVAATQLQPGQIRATQMDGATVYDAQNQKLGDIRTSFSTRTARSRRWCSTSARFSASAASMSR